MKGMISFNPHTCKITAMLHSESEIKRLITQLRKLGVDVEIQLLSRCG